MMLFNSAKHIKFYKSGENIMAYDREIRTDIDWDSLGFSYMPTRSNIRYKYRNGAWDKGELTSDY